jgi:hypothetical protein
MAYLKSKKDYYVMTKKSVFRQLLDWQALVECFGANQVGTDKEPRALFDFKDRKWRMNCGETKTTAY